MIVDAHAHVWESRDWRPARVWQDFPRIWSRTMGESGEVDAGFFEREVAPRLIDPGAVRLFAEMDEAGIDASLILNIDLVHEMGEAPVPWEQSWARLAELAAAHPGRLYLAPGIEPRRPNASELLRLAVTEWGARAVKLWPPAGFYPTDEACAPLYRTVLDLGVAVIFHVGFAPYPFFSKYGHPIYVDSVAVDYPDLPIVMAHIGPGFGWYADAVAVATTKPNVHVEVSMWQGMGDTRPDTFHEALAFMRDRIGIDRMLFGSDRTGTTLRVPQTEWVEMFRRLPETGTRHGYPFSQEQVDLILGGNAQRLFSLPDARPEGGRG